MRLQPRRDSKAADLWRWAVTQSRAWSPAEAAEGADMSIRRARAFVAVLARVHMVLRVREVESQGWRDGLTPALYMVPHHRRAAPPPILKVKRGCIVGVRVRK